MNSQDFLRLIDQAFLPFLTELDFTMRETAVSGRYYHATFSNGANEVSISFEPGENALFVQVFTIGNGTRSSIDDIRATPRLSDLNARFMKSVSRQERETNAARFERILVQDSEERHLVKTARDLSLVLPRFLSAIAEDV